MMGRKDVGGVTLYPGYESDEDAIEEGKAVKLWNNYVYFGTISRSMYTLFNVVILAEFSEFGRAMIEKQPWMALFFVFFIVFTTFGILNVIIGVIVDNTMEAAKTMDAENAIKKKQQKLRLLENIRDIVFALDSDQSGTISTAEMQEGWNHPAMQEVLKDMHLPAAFSAKEFMFLLDREGDRELRFEEFITNFYRVINSDSFQLNCCLHASLNEVKTEVKGIKRQFESLREENAEMKAEMRQNMEGFKDILLSIRSGLEKSGVVESRNHMSEISEMFRVDVVDSMEVPLPASKLERTEAPKVNGVQPHSPVNLPESIRTSLRSWSKNRTSKEQNPT
eukprot:gnl/MRDRNA2_/MRDRNA2_19604_c0_seq2.p1 gnl/MRDRNA2_/MRDRNA2_19604_c0~~gnl/MRDRNA2_/MRDRNA2_19604_c0_seq2.p1  ORF type:complete len:336 (-),score=60.49 gnl/MRDRNA2_/MRDRNA2_19604_c0_seq2:41-1048(-)